MSIKFTIQAVDNGGDFYISVGVSRPLWKGSGNKFIVETYNHPFVFEASSQVFALVNDLVGEEDLTPRDFREVVLREKLDALDLAIYSMRVKNTHYTLGQLLGIAIASSENPIEFVVGRLLESIPWEITSPNGHINGMLGSVAFISGNLFDVDDGRFMRSTKSKRPSIIPFSGTVHIRAAGNDTLVGANDEEVFVRHPNPTTLGTLAPAVSDPHSEPAFFQHFAPDNYSVVHIFSHCDYDDPLGSGFRLHVTNSYPLGVSAFYSNQVMLQPRVLHFLNVCEGAPTQSNKNRSLVEYMSKQQDAAAVVASLVLVRSRAAVDMAKAFYSYFLPADADGAGQSIAEAMYNARKELWERGIAAGFLYRAYGNSGTKLEPFTAKQNGASHVG